MRGFSVRIPLLSNQHNSTRNMDHAQNGKQGPIAKAEAAAPWAVRRW